jgi:hypothetical protein
MSRIRHRSGMRQTLERDFESITTEQLLSLHERHFGRLDAPSKARIVKGARMRGWDRTWDLDGVGV